MERTMWSDERLDERFDSIDRRFDAVDDRLDRLEGRVDAGFREIRDIRQLMFLLWGPTMLGIFASIAAALFAHG